MLIATEMSSERLLWDEEALYLVGTAVLSWFIAAVALGDYMYTQMCQRPVKLHKQSHVFWACK
jgi:hypothetical protein